jgi:CheY-like chemotaxis protein
MSNPPTVSTRALFVDDDEAFLRLVEQAFGEIGQGTWEIHLAADTSRALQILRAQPIDLAVLDVYMPDLNGLQVLEILHRDFPRLLKVFLTSATDERMRVAGLEGGAELFLEKPSNLAGMESVFATLNELVKWRQKQGSRGMLRRAGLLDIVKLECVSGNSRVFEVFNEAIRGFIFIKSGAIIHAETEGRRGQSAFTYLASLTDAEFNLKQYVEPVERSVDRQWEFLFLEAFQLQEQMAQAAQEAKAAEAAAAAKPAAEPEPGFWRGPTATPALTPPKPAAATAEPAPPRLKLAALTSPATAPAPAPAVPVAGHRVAPVPLPKGPPPTRPEAPIPPEPARPLPPEPVEVQPAPARVPLPLEADQPSFRIEEMLICSQQREVLYEWQCARAEQRLRLVDQLGRQLRRLGEGLGLGQFDRAELQGAGSRMVIRLQDDTHVLMRSNTKARPSPGGTTPLHESLGPWLERQKRVTGLHGCGIARPGGSTLSHSCSADYPEDKLAGAWRGVGEIFDGLRAHEFPAWQLRLIYERAQFCCVKRDDELVLGVLLTKNPQVLDVPAVERMLNEFGALRAA